MNGWMDRFVEEWMDGWMARWKNGQMEFDRQTDYNGWGMDEWMDGWMKEGMDINK